MEGNGWCSDQDFDSKDNEQKVDLIRFKLAATAISLCF